MRFFANARDGGFVESIHRPRVVEQVPLFISLAVRVQPVSVTNKKHYRLLKPVWLIGRERAMKLGQMVHVRTVFDLRLRPMPEDVSEHLYAEAEERCIPLMSLSST